MRKIILALSVIALLTTSCGTKKKIAALESKNKENQYPNKGDTKKDV